MFPPNWSEQDKKIAREAQRNNSYISLTWSLFNCYLHEDMEDPRKALQKALAAMEVWKEFEDGQHMEFPEVVEKEGKDFGEQMKEAMIAGMQAFKGMPLGRMRVEDEMLKSKLKEIAGETIDETITDEGKIIEDIKQCCATGYMTGGKNHDDWCRGT